MGQDDRICRNAVTMEFCCCCLFIHCLNFIIEVLMAFFNASNERKKEKKTQMKIQMKNLLILCLSIIKHVCRKSAMPNEYFKRNCAILVFSFTILQKKKKKITC